MRPVVLLSMAAFCVAATMRVADPMIPRVAAEFGTTAGSAGAIATTFTVAYGLCQIVYGPLGERHGKYHLIDVATTLSGVLVAAGASPGPHADLPAHPTPPSATPRSAELRRGDAWG